MFCHPSDNHLGGLVAKGPTAAPTRPNAHAISNMYRVRIHQSDHPREGEYLEFPTLLDITSVSDSDHRYIPKMRFYRVYES